MPLDTKSLYAHCQKAFDQVVAAQQELNKPASEADWQHFEGLLQKGKLQLAELAAEAFGNQAPPTSLSLNLKLLTNYYKHLFSRASEERSQESLSELKYHLLELMAAWK